MSDTQTTELAQALGLDPGEYEWDTLLSLVRCNNMAAKHPSERVGIEHTVRQIILSLDGIAALREFLDRIETKLSDQAVYEHLLTCAQAVDDEETKRKLKDFAELFAFEFCLKP